MNKYDFSEQLEWSNEFKPEIEVILKKLFPAFLELRKASYELDKRGTDYLIIQSNGSHPINIDVKIRKEDFALKGNDDLALETWSVCNSKIGWTRDSTKNTDYVLWYWTETKRYCLIPFPILCKVFSDNWEDWRNTYFCVKQSSENWNSECVFIPRLLLFEQITKYYCNHNPLMDKKKIKVNKIMENTENKTENKLFDFNTVGDERDKLESFKVLDGETKTCKFLGEMRTVTTKFGETNLIEVEHDGNKKNWWVNKRNFDILKQFKALYVNNENKLTGLTVTVSRVGKDQTDTRYTLSLAGESPKGEPSLPKEKIYSQSAPSLSKESPIPDQSHLMARFCWQKTGYEATIDTVQRCISDEFAGAGVPWDVVSRERAFMQGENPLVLVHKMIGVCESCGLTNWYLSTGADFSPRPCFCGKPITEWEARTK